ncbi:DUF2938 domain-containing protein [Luteimonas aquatica]|uniref:DUF2938 domain-containing protein n=1 Tax=Luteimonas aquatica TaxID=450364 RepID=UPI001F59C9EC|nr:DUF2938 domain-containing protein [Luteimonas aquatica]
MGADVHEFAARAAFIGIGATAVIDLWALALRQFFGIRPLDWGLVGRWLGHLPRGRLVHESIATAAPVHGERALGWAAHYAVGIVFAAALIAAQGLPWARLPTAPPALAFGLLTVVFPFFVLQPGLGAGIAASKMSRPGQARLRSLATHAVFGIGLYVSALLSAVLIRS